MELIFKLNVSATHFYQDLSKDGRPLDKINFGWEAGQNAIVIAYNVDQFNPSSVGKTIESIREHMPYMTQGITYNFSTEKIENSEPVTLISADTDKFGKLHLHFQVVLGENFDMDIPIDALSKEQLRNVKAGSTWYASMEFDK
jgi:hypothetical protein